MSGPIAQNGTGRRRAIRAAVVVAAALVLAPAAVVGAGEGRAAERPAPDGAYVVVPGHAERIQAWLAPIRVEQPFAGGCVVEGIALQKTEIRLRVRETTGATHTLVLTGPRDGRGPADTASFALRPAAGEPEDIRAWPCAARVAARLAASDDGTFWRAAEESLARQGAAERGERAQRAAEQARRAPVDHGVDAYGAEGAFTPATGSLELAIGWATMAAALALLVLLLARSWRGVGGHLAPPAAGGLLPAPPRRGELLALGALTAAAFAVRAAVGPSFILATNHDVMHVHDALCLAGRADACGLTAAYPLGVKAVHALVLLATGPSVVATFWTNAVLAALAVPAAWLAVSLLAGGRREVGWLAAVALAALPLHIRFSPSGSLVPGLVTFATLALAALLVVARTGARRHLWIAALAAALMTQARFEGPAYLLVLLLAALVAPPRPWRRLLARPLLPHAIAAAGLVAAASLWPVLSAAADGAALGADGPSFLARNLAIVAAASLVPWVVSVALDRAPGARLVRWPLGLAAVAWGVWLVGPAELLRTDAWPAWVVGGEALRSFTDTTGVPVLNARAVPAPLLAAALLGLSCAFRPAWRGAVSVLVLWAGLASALGVMKHTGTIPFEGMRTAVSASAALAGLAGIGAAAVLDLLPRRAPRAARGVLAGTLALTLAAAPLLSLPLLRAGDFNNRAQVRFLARTLPALPGPALVVLPDRGPLVEPPLDRHMRAANLWATLGMTVGRRGDRFLGASVAVRDPALLVELYRDHAAALLYWEGLDCRRNASATGALLPDCAAMHERFALEPLAAETIANRPLESDFYEDILIRGPTVTMTIYRVAGLRSR